MEGDIQILCGLTHQAIVRGNQNRSKLRSSKRNRNAAARIRKLIRQEIPRSIEQAAAAGEESACIGTLASGIDYEAGTKPEFMTLKGVALNIFLTCGLAGLTPFIQETTPNRFDLFVGWANR